MLVAPLSSGLSTAVPSPSITDRAEELRFSLKDISLGKSGLFSLDLEGRRQVIRIKPDVSSYLCATTVRFLISCVCVFVSAPSASVLPRSRFSHHLTALLVPKKGIFE